MSGQSSDLVTSARFSGGGGNAGAMRSVYTIQGSATPKAHRDAEDEIASLQKSFIGLLGHQQGQNLFRMIQEAPQTFANDDRPMVQRLVQAIEKYRAGQVAHQAMISEIGTQIDLLQNRVAGSLREQSNEHQQQMAEVITTQDEKIADLETKLYSLGNGVADLEQNSSSQLEVVRTDVQQMSTMLDEAGEHLRTIDDSIIQQQHFTEKCISDLEQKMRAQQEADVGAMTAKAEGTLESVGKLSAILDMHKEELDNTRGFRRSTDDAIAGLQNQTRAIAERTTDRIDAVEKKLSSDIATVQKHVDDVRPELAKAKSTVDRLQVAVDGIDNRRDMFREDIEQLRAAMSAIGHEQHERTNTLAQTLAKMSEEQKALAARVGKIETSLQDLSSSTQRIIGGISQLMSGFALRGS